MDDLISRKDAIEAIRKCRFVVDAIEKIRGLPSAQPYTEDEIQKMQDLEQAQLDKAYELGRQSAYPETDGFCDGCKEYDQEKHFCPRFDRVIKKTVEEMKAEQRWIPVSERLPEPRVAVLGYAPKFKNIFALYYDSVMGWMVWSPIRDDCLPNSQGEIIAWRPLPEPYEERWEDAKVSD